MALTHQIASPVAFVQAPQKLDLDVRWRTARQDGCSAPRRESIRLTKVVPEDDAPASSTGSSMSATSSIASSSSAEDTPIAELGNWPADHRPWRPASG